MFSENILQDAEKNDVYRRVLMTGPNAQVVVMAIPVGDDIGAEVHPHTDQVFLVVAGSAYAQIGAQERTVGPGDIVYVPQGKRHDLINNGHEPLKLVTVYAPPHHAPGTVHMTKADATGEHVPPGW